MRFAVNAYPSIPSATYRLQFHKGFTFEHARQLVPYLHQLGISHVYTSPIFQASPGSIHGYDICDHNRINPELGTRDEFEAFARELRQSGMSQILDFVPNHMGIAEATNVWWMDVLENGPSSPYANYFDIDWHPTKRELEYKVLLPILSEQYGRVLEKGGFKLHFEEGAFYVGYFNRNLPLAPRTARPLLQQTLEKLGRDQDDPTLELASIITALDYLPARTECDPSKVAERAREKEIIKGRLSRLCEAQPRIRQTIEEVVSELESGGGDQNFEGLDALLNAQPYRLANWRVAAEEINYRRFFDINTLAALRMELPEVFAATHRLVFDLLASGGVSGLRIDHVDGLWHPRDYLEKLQFHYAAMVGVDPSKRPLYLLVEKILGPGEHLRADWPTHGTTGYEFAGQVAAVLVDRSAEKIFSDTYARFIGGKTPYSEVVYESKRLITRVSMASEVNGLAQMLNRISETNRWYRDFTLNALTTAIREVIACFPVYRTYLEPAGEASPEDVRIILRAIACARRRNLATERTVFEFLRDVLIPPADNPHAVDEEARRQFVMKFQQCTGPIAAKGVEDTAFYVYNRLVALNEVGGEPGIFGATCETFHQQNASRLAESPHSLLTTSTHDTKRSEDVRARLAALSELPAEWTRALRRWSVANRKHRQEIDGDMAPDKNEEYLLYQILLGSWPLAPMSPDQHSQYVQRIQAYMEKALHEAKENSSWIEPNLAWDKAVKDFAERILRTTGRNIFLESFEPFATRIAELGAINSLTQTVLKLTVPGVPDIYQGQELWDLSLVDPDNRRPVDYDTRRQQLDSLTGTPPATDLLRDWRDGRIKLFATQKLLRLRRVHPLLFSRGSYVPVNVEGEFAQSCLAFIREEDAARILVIVPRLSARIGFPPIGELWKETRLIVALAGQWRELFTGQARLGIQALHVSEAFQYFPFAVYVSS